MIIFIALCGKEITQMNRNQKKRQLNRGLTISLALLLAATICITIIAFVSAKRSKPGDSTDGSSSSSSSTLQTTSSTTPISTTPDKPTDKPVSVIPDEFLCPVDAGKLCKEHSSDVPVWSLTMEDYRVHAGIDIEADAGTPVEASAGGEITEIFADPMMGQSIVITHADGCKTVYKNLQTKLPEDIASGAKVKAGDTIGYVGDTALLEISDSPHLHFEIYLDGAAVDPLTYFDVPEKNAQTDFED